MAEITAAEYALSIQGMASIRTLFRSTDDSHARVQEMLETVGQFDSPLGTTRIGVNPVELSAGYARWASTYDGPNPAIEAEEPVVRALLGGLPPPGPLAPRVAVDVACGTGRHGAYLAALGYAVTGVDATAEMLALAAEKVPVATFKVGSMDALPIDDGSADVVTCALAIAHLADPAPAYREIGRILRPGGHTVISDIHPTSILMGGAAVFNTGALDFDVIPDHYQPIGATLNTLAEVGLDVVRCEEIHRTAASLESIPLYPYFPAAVTQAFGGLPFIIVWHLVKS